MKLEPPVVPEQSNNQQQDYSKSDKEVQFTVEKQLEELESIRHDIRNSTSEDNKNRSGFLSKIFTWNKNKQQSPLSQSVPQPTTESTGANIHLPALPELPSIEAPISTPQAVIPPLTVPKKIAKLPKHIKEKKGKQEKISKKDKMLKEPSDTPPVLFSGIPNAEKAMETGSNMLITPEPINDVQVQDLMQQADQHVDDNKQAIQSTSLLSKPEISEKPELQTFNIPETHVQLNNELIAASAPPPDQEQEYIVPEMPIINADETSAFKTIQKDHEKLRTKLGQKIRDPKSYIDKKELMELFRRYDEHIERKIEDKETSVTHKMNKMERFHKVLRHKEQQLKKMHAYLRNAEKGLKEKHAKFHQLVNTEVEKKVLSRVKKEKELLKKEVLTTIKLNSQLQSKLNAIEKDRILFEKKSKKLLSDEQAKLNSAQTLYDKKIKELTEEKKNLDAQRKLFEQKRNASLALLNKGDIIAKELAELEQVKSYIEKTKSMIKKDIHEDREMKHAIQVAEQRIIKEKKNLDNMVFSKYIASKLRSIVPDTIAKDIIVSNPPTTNQETTRVLDMISECKNTLTSGNILDAKRKYNAIKRAFDNGRFDRIDKGLLFNEIRALYTDIQLYTVEESQGYR